MGKQRKIENAKAAQADRARKMDILEVTKKEPDFYQAVIVTPENAEVVIEWVAYHTEGGLVRADYGDVVVRNTYDDSFEIWERDAFDKYFKNNN